MPKKPNPNFPDGSPKTINPFTNELWRFGDVDTKTGLIFHRYQKRAKSGLAWYTKVRFREYKKNIELTKEKNKVRELNPRTGKPWVIGEFNSDNGKYFRQYNPRTKSGVVWTSKSGFEKVKQYTKRYLEENPDKIKQWLLNNRENRLLIYKNYNKKNKESRNTYAKDYSKKFREKCQGLQQKWRKNNPNKVSKQNKRATVKRKKEATKELNIFYRKMKIPKLLWHKSEFALEIDLQTALEHILANKYNLYIEHEYYHEQGITDIYLHELNLLIEVKLHSSMWSIESVNKQVKRYNKIARTLVVSIDGKPEGWFTPKELFSIIESELSDIESTEN